MSESDGRLAAEIAAAERVRDEGIAAFQALGLPRPAPFVLSEAEQADADEALREFQERLANGEWYGDDDDDEVIL